jgi:hypothetical protein
VGCLPHKRENRARAVRLDRPSVPGSLRRGGDGRPDGFLDKTEVTCALANDLVDGVSTALHGYCIVTDKDGDKAFLVHQGKGTAPGIIAGNFQWTGGTGKFTGIQGNNIYRVTSIGKNPASWIVWDGEWQLP